MYANPEVQSGNPVVWEARGIHAPSSGGALEGQSPPIGLVLADLTVHI